MEISVTLLAILDKLRNSNHVINERDTTDRGDTGQPLRSPGVSFQTNCARWIKSRRDEELFQVHCDAAFIAAVIALSGIDSLKNDHERLRGAGSFVCFFYNLL